MRILKIKYLITSLAIIFGFISSDAISAVSEDEANKIYLAERSALVAGYQNGENVFADQYSDWKAASTAPANPGVHSRRYMMTFVNEIGYDTYVKFASQGVEMPLGTVIAKESFKIKKNGKFVAGPLFLMEKVIREQSPKTDGWVYSRVKANGKPMSASQKFCHSCHKAFSGQDALGYPDTHVRVGYVAPSSDAEPLAIADGNIEAGKQAFQTCIACHQVGPEAKNAFGPVLNGVVGRGAGTYSGYSYSGSLKSASKQGLVWSKQLLFEWLEGPSKFLKKYTGDESANSKMPISVSEEKVRNDLIAYLSSLSDNEK